MNDKDKEAFEEWWMESFKGMSDIDVIKYKDVGKQTSLYGWQAACLFKQKEINELKLEIMDIKGKRNKSKFENAKLRECVEFYAVKGLARIEVGQKFDEKLCHDFYVSGGYARQTLKELEDK